MKQKQTKFNDPKLQEVHEKYGHILELYSGNFDTCENCNAPLPQDISGKECKDGCEHPSELYNEAD